MIASLRKASALRTVGATPLTALVLGVLSAARPRAVAELAAVAVGLAAVPVLRSLQARTLEMLLGAFLGAGELTAVLLGSASSFVLVILLAACTPMRRRRWGATGLTWASGALSLALSVGITMAAAHVSISMILTVVAVIVVAGWALPSEEGDSGDDTVAPIGVLLVAGLVAGLFVFASMAFGRPLVGMTAHQAINSIVSGGATRGSGSFGTPNEAGLVLSATSLGALVELGYHRVGEARQGLALACLAVCVPAMIVTGSRASVLAFLAGAAALALPLLRQRPLMSVVLIVMGIAGVGFATHIGTFSGRSLNPFGATDPSSVYRAHVRSYLLSRVKWTQITGYGFSSGNTLASNPVSGTLPNVDEAWIYALLCLGTLSVLGFGLLAIAGIASAMATSVICAVAASAFLVAASLTENLFVLQGPAVCGMLLLACCAAGRPRRRVSHFGGSRVRS